MAASPGTVVVPLDGSKNAEHAVPVAAEVARAYRTGLRFVHVGDEAALKTPDDLKHAEGILQQYATTLAAANGASLESCAVLKGSPARTVLDDAAAARFVVLATHGRGGVKATVIGSVADKIVRGATVPTLVVPVAGGATLEGRALVVGVDGSPAAEASLGVARDLAAKLKMQLVLVRAFDFPPAVGVEFAYYPVDLGAALEEGSQEYLASVVKPGERTISRQGYPATVLADAADEENAGLIVVASHGKNLAERIALGSTTGRLMHASRRPLLVVPTRG